MHGKIPRILLKDLESQMGFIPIVAISGPRQCGKTTLTGLFSEKRDRIITLDLERPMDLRKLEDPESFFRENSDFIVCIDEIQRKPDLFRIPTQPVGGIGVR